VAAQQTESGRTVRYFSGIKFISARPGKWISEDGRYGLWRMLAGTIHQQWEVHLIIGENEFADLIGYGLTMQEAVEDFLRSPGRHRADDEVSRLAGTVYNVSLAYRLIGLGILDTEHILLPVAQVFAAYGFDAYYKHADGCWTEDLAHIGVVAVGAARAEAMPLSCLDLPCRAAMLPIGIGGHHVLFLLDGRHRLFKAHLAGREYLKTYLLTQTDCIDRIIWH
jgi:hypothetical protein